jgi:putative membrane protein
MGSVAAWPALLTGSVSPEAPLAQERVWEWGFNMHPMWWMWSVGGLAMMVVMFAFWAVVITAIVIAIRWFVRQAAPARPDAAIEILRQRYARGEIDRQEFEARRRDLEAHR